MEDILKAIIQKGVYAASGDNSQPWRFVIRGNSVLIYNLPDRDLPFYNFRQLGSYVAHGGAIENMSIAAKELGYIMHVDLFPQNFGSSSKISQSETWEDKNCVAKINFETSTKESQPLFSFIEDRCTNRKPYTNVALTSDEQSALTSVPSAIGNGEILFISEANSKKHIASALAINETIALEVPELHRDFFGHMIWSEKEEHEKKSGLYLKTLELPPPLQALFHIIRYPIPIKLLNMLGFSKLAAKGNARIYETGSVLTAIVVPSNTKEDYVLAGRLMQRLWLEVTRLGLSMQPVTGLLFLAQRIFANEPKDLSPKHIAMIKNGYETIRETFNVPSNKTIALTVRIGHGGTPSARSSRMPPNITVEHL